MKRNSITDIKSLRFEILQAEAIQNEKEKKLNDSLQVLSGKLHPSNLVREAISGFFNSKSKTGADNSFEKIVGFIITDLLLRNASPVIKAAGVAIGSLISSELMGEGSEKIIQRLKDLFEKIKGRFRKADSSFDESEIY